jgi:tetratricopeptide (TPR) repeat protein
MLRLWQGKFAEHEILRELRKQIVGRGGRAMASLTAVVPECPQCGAPVKQGSKTCYKCYSDYIITSVSSFKKLADVESGVKKYLRAYEASIRSGGESAEIYTAMGTCQLQRGLHKHALNCFEKAIALLPEDGDAYYYAAVALLNGKRPFLSTLPVIKQAVAYIDLALELSDSGAHYYLKYLVHADYYEKKQLRCSPSSGDLLRLANEYGMNEVEAEDIKQLVGLS